MLSLGVAAAPALAGKSQSISIPGLEEPAEIRVDRWGVAHLYAESERDLFFVQGFNAARDRLFQIDLWRRRGLGQLAAVFGREFAEQDRAARLFLYRGDMDREWRMYDAGGTHAARTVAQRFADGVNAYIDWLDANPERLPWEFTFAGYRPARWAADDIVRIRSHGLTRNLGSEVARAQTLCIAGDVAVDEIRFGLSNGWKARVPEGLEPCLPSDVLGDFQLATQSFALATPPAEPAMDSPASNSWVVGPAKSATGRPILANDPHRAYQAPSLRYLVHLSAPGLDVIGAGEPSLPGISLGHNGTIAFGITIFNIDQEDLYVYELKPGDPTRYGYGGGWEPFRIERETIAVRGESPRSVELRFTRHGPVIRLDAARGRAYAVRTAWLEPGTSPYFDSVASMRARDFDSFRNAVRNWGAPTLNQVYADASGNIGWIATGFAPRRPNWDGLLPVPGDGRYEWDGSWRGRLPESFNPPQGWIATANAYNIPADYPALERKLGFEWTDPSRHRRIHELLGAAPRVTLEDSERFQNDVLSIPARRLVALLAPLTSEDEETASALDLLRGWDAVMSAESPEAALHEVWQTRHLRPGFRDALAGPAASAVVATSDMDVMLQTLERPETRFGAGGSARRDELLLATLKSAWQEMVRLQGPDSKAWQWGRSHVNLAEHPFAATLDVERRARVNVGPIPKDGSEYTLNQSVASAADLRQVQGPSVRIVIDVGNWDESRAINHPGQSGDPQDPHYRDLAPMWRNGDYFPLLYSRQAVEKATERVIKLVPAPSR